MHPAEKRNNRCGRFVVGLVLQSYIPPVSSIKSDPYCRKIIGRGVRSTSAPDAVLMWSMYTEPTDNAVFKPDHFELLKERRDIVDMMSVSLAAEAQAAADEVDEAAIDETVDQIIHDDSESDDSSTKSEVVTISSEDDAEAADHVDVRGSIQTASMRPLPDGD